MVSGKKGAKMATEQTQLRTPNVQETIANLGQNRRMVLVGALVVTIVLTLIIVVFAWSRSTSKGNVIELVKRLDQDRALEIVSKLKAEDIEAKIEDSELPGKVIIKVYQKDFDKSALTLARSDLLQDDGFNLFDKSDWAASDYDKRVKMMRAINGDLSRIVSRMTGIKWSTVRVNIPEPQLFSQYQAPTTATVQVELPEGNENLTRAQVRSVINLLVGYVPNLQKNNVSIIDTNGKTYSAVETEEIAASELLEESERVNKVIQKRIEEYLEPLLGVESFIVRVSSDISRKKIEESATTFAEGVVGQEQIGDERLGGAPGSAPQAVGPQIAGADANKNYIRSNRVTQKYPSYRQKTTSTPPGRIARITVAVAIDKDLPARISLNQLREGVAAITSPNTTLDDVKITVAEFATHKPFKAPRAQKPAVAVSGITNSLNQVLGFFSKMPLWASITLIVVGLLIVLSSFRGPATPVVPQGPSTVSQINQGMQRQFQRPEAQIPMGTQQIQEPIAEIPGKQPDLTGILTSLNEAATERPEYLVSRLQVWLEEGTSAVR